MAKQVMEEGNKIQWRKQEFRFVTGVILVSIIASLWAAYDHPQTLQSPFDSTATPFNIFRNKIFPDLLTYVVIYLIYIFISFYSFPKFLKKREAKRGNILDVWFPVVLGAALLGLIFNVAEYYRHEWQFNYPGFSIFFNKYNPRSQLGLGANFVIAEAIVIIYLLYVAIRELSINIILRSRQRDLNISISNKVTAFVFITISVYVVLLSIGLTRHQMMLERTTLIISSVFATFISNVYWIFPGQDLDSILSKKVLKKLLPTTFVYALPLTLFNNNDHFAIVYCWILQLFIITPLTWLYYQYNKENILKLKRVETALKKSTASLQFLRSQINPHFLFNSLNTLYGTALQENATRTSEGIQMLGDMMRFMLHENNQDLISMNKEIAYLQNYVTLQKLRTDLSDSIKITDNIGTQHCSLQIAPMLLIPFVENAFKHGISLKEPSWIHIDLTCTEKTVHFVVRNSVHPFSQRDPEKDRSGVGLQNVEERLRLLYSERHRLEVSRSDKEFTIILSLNP